MDNSGKTIIEDIDALSIGHGLPSYSCLAQVVSDLLDWADHTGGWEAPIWVHAQCCISEIRRLQDATSMQPSRQ